MRDERQTGLLLDMRDSAAAIGDYLNGISQAAFYENAEKQDAVLRRLEIIGEAAGRISPEVQKEFPAIPFREIRGMRNILPTQNVGEPKLATPSPVSALALSPPSPSAAPLPVSPQGRTSGLDSRREGLLLARGDATDLPGYHGRKHDLFADFPGAFTSSPAACAAPDKSATGVEEVGYVFSRLKAGLKIFRRGLGGF